jgi:hypothetical protein
MLPLMPQCTAMQNFTLHPPHLSFENMNAFLLQEYRYGQYIEALDMDNEENFF